MGNIKIELGNRGNPHIKYVVSNTKDIFDKIVPYFIYLYGHKRSDLVKLQRIYDLSKILSNTFSPQALRGPPWIKNLFQNKFI